MANGFIENGFIIDLSNASGTAQIIDELGDILEMTETKDKQICLKLGNVDLKQSQMLSIKALISAMGSELAIVDTDSELTKVSAVNLEIVVSKLTNEIKIPEIEDEAQETINSEEEIEIEDEASEEIADDIELITEKIEPKKQEKEIPTESENIDNSEIKEIEQIEETEENKAELPKENPSTPEQLDSSTIRIESEIEISKLPTLYLQQTLRSGRTITYDGNIVLIGDVHPGSEIIAKGDITVWGVLGGIAHAGARGNDYAKIRALKINAIQLRISGFYARRPDSLNIPFIQRENIFTPEEARVNNGEIAIYKINEA